MIHRYALLSLLAFYGLNLQAMESEDPGKELAYNQLVPKIVLMHHYNKKLDQELNKEPFNKCLRFYTIVRLAQLYNKASTAHESELKSFDAKELQAFFNNTTMWDIDDQSAEHYAHKSSKFLRKLVLTPDDLKTLTSYPQAKSFPVENICSNTYRLIKSIPHDDLLRNQLLQERHRIINEYNQQMSSR